MHIALLQMTSGIDPAANAATIAGAAAEAAREGAVMLFTPEISGLVDRDRERARRAIRDEDRDLVLAAARAAAEEHGLWIALGSLAIDPGRADGRLANRSFLIGSDGAVRARYDKMHLFDVDLPSGESWRESSAYAAGDSAVVASTPPGLLGLSVCYDLRFPALYQALSGAGATVLAVPSAFTVPTGTAHWHLLLRARAVESAAFVIAAAQTGQHEDGRATYGHSLVVDPWGTVLLDMGRAAKIGYCDIDMSQVDTVRERIPVVAHRRAVSAL